MNQIMDRWLMHIIFGALAIAGGILIVVWPNNFMELYMVILGILALVSGTLQILVGGTNKGNALTNAILIRAIITIILGIVLIIAPFFMAKVAVYIIGAVFIIFGVLMLMGIASSERLTSTEMRIMGIIFVIIGVLVCVFNDQALKVIGIIIGVSLIIVGLLNILIGVQEKKLISQLQN